MLHGDGTKGGEHGWVDRDGIVEELPHDLLHKVDRFQELEEKSHCIVRIVHALHRWVLPRSVGRVVGVWAPDVGI